MKPTMLFAAVAAAALTYASQASAAAVVYTYKGTVSSVTDPSAARFGGAINAGDAFTAVFTRDDATPGVHQHSGPAPFEYSEMYGDGSTAPVLAKLTIGSTVFDFGADPAFSSHTGQQTQYDYLDIYPDDADYELFQHYSNDSGFTDIGSISNYHSQSLNLNVTGYGTNYLYSGDYHTLGNLTAAGTPGLNWIGYADFFHATYNFDTDESSQEDSRIYLTPTALSVAVPEPASWALMIGGFGLVGAVLRRRRLVPAMA